MTDPLRSALERGIAALGQDPGAHPCGAYLSFLRLLEKWNRAYSLSGVRDLEEMVYRHILDSLSVLPWVRGNRCLDAGTGAGLPGLVLALARPEQHWVLLDGNGKKIRFLEQAVMELACTNVEPAQGRLETYTAAQPFSTIASRAFGSLEDFSRGAHLLAPGGIMLAMKGARVENEIGVALRRKMHVAVQPLDVPGARTRRALVLLEPVAARGGHPSATTMQ